LKPIYKSNLNLSELEFIEIRSNLIGDLITRLGLIIIPIILVTYCVNYENQISKYVGIGIGVFMLIAGLLLLPTTLQKLKVRSKRDSLLFNSKGVTIKRETPNMHKFMKWNEINSAVVKLYEQQYGYDSFLLLSTKSEGVVEVDLNLLKLERSDLTTKSEWKNTLHLDEPKFQEMRILLGKYLKENYERDDQ